MKKILWIAVLVFSFMLLTNLFSQTFTYVGAGKCKICHQSEKIGQQYPIWEKAGHSQSFAALSSDKAKAVAQELGVQNPPENPKCLMCHAPLFEKAPELKQEGVTCEVCHGPGSEYKKLTVMKNKDEAVKNGLIIYANPDAIKAKCLNCHEKDHNKPFDFAVAWEKIKHPIPGK